MGDDAYFFQTDYFTARERFRAAAAALRLPLEVLDLPPARGGQAPLTIDAAVLRQPQAQAALVISSGTHGVEGFLGSAIQLGLMAALQRPGALSEWLGEGVNLLLVHALNPWGYAQLRRWNEDGIDLNRNFLLPGQAYAGAPPLYGALNRFINPQTAPKRHVPLWPSLLRPLQVHGFRALKRTIAFGQYEFPRGLYFGGKRPAATQRLLGAALPRWLQGMRRVMHLDVHTGLGEWAEYMLLVEGGTATRAAALARHFGTDAVEVEGTGDESFPSRGGLGPWCEALLPQAHYDFAALEFGSYSSLRVFDALRDENRAFHWADIEGRQAWTRTRLLECFAPASRQWRQRCVEQGLAVCRQAAAMLAGRGPG